MILRDPVHGLISFEDPTTDIVVRLLDTRELQRLRRIRALGPASVAFPGAEHSRFAHAVGSAYVMKRYLDRVAQISHDLPEADRIDAHTARVALAAALLHDLGHGPLSHTFEGLVPGQPSHETWTSRLLLDPDTEVFRVLRAFGADVPGAVERLIHGEHPIPHLARAVSGTFDVDRCDYLLRDSYMTGVRYGLLDVEWLLRSLRLHASSPGARVELAVDGHKGLTAVEGFFLARLYMYRQVYLHKAVRAAELLVRAWFRRLIELGPTTLAPRVLLEVLTGESVACASFLGLDDHALFGAIAASTQSTDAELRELSSRLLHRRLWKTLALRSELAVQDPARLEEARARLAAVQAHHATEGRSFFASLDVVTVDAFPDDEVMLVVEGPRTQRLVDASPVLRGLSREAFVHVRAIFAPELRREVEEALRDFT